MKNGACPKCQSKKLYVIDEATLENFTCANLVFPLSLAAHYGPTADKTWLGQKNRRVAVRYSVYVCAACAYSETYANDLELLAKLADNGFAKVRRVG